MPLHSTLTLEELDDEERFDFLVGTLDQIARVDEVHADEGNDSEYIFLVWLKYPDADPWEFRRAVRRNIWHITQQTDGRTWADGRGLWHFDVDANEDSYFVVVRTWL